MCTSIALRTPSFLFGRNLDLECAFGQRVVIVPRRFPFSWRGAGNMPSHYALIGMATVQDGYPLFAEAANEKGLCMAGLNFPGNAYYDPEDAPGKRSVSPFELIPFLLGQCADAAEVRALLREIHIVAVPFSEKIPLSPLHWHIADKDCSIVLEATRGGTRVYDNPADVMTNNPTFDFHLTNLRQYMNVTSASAVNRFSERLSLTPFCNGLGAIGLPGDLSSASRFVRAAFMTANTPRLPDEAAGVAQFFHLLDSVAMPMGSVVTKEGLSEITDYACCFSAASQTFYYKTYRNNQLTAVRLAGENLDADALREFPLRDEQAVRYEN